MTWTLLMKNENKSKKLSICLIRINSVRSVYPSLQFHKNNRSPFRRQLCADFTDDYDLYFYDWISGTILLKEVKYAIKSMGLEIKTNELNDWLPILAKKKAKSGERKRGHRKKDSSNGANKEDDDDESIAVDFDVFSRIVAPKLQQREKSKFAFGLFDVEKKGFITVGDLKRIASELGEDSMTDEDLQEMINEADRDGDGIINQTEFFRISKKINL